MTVPMGNTSKSGTGQDPWQRAVERRNKMAQQLQTDTLANSLQQSSASPKPKQTGEMS